MYDHPNILVAILDEDAPRRFTRWPHHITVLPWFKANTEALTSLESIAAKFLPVAAEIGNTAMFGARNDIPVRLVESEALKDMHRAMLANHTGVLGLNNSRYSHEAYVPHITLSGHNDPEPGRVIISSLSLVRGVGKKPHKRIVKQFE